LDNVVSHVSRTTQHNSDGCNFLFLCNLTHH
jgi:hypothetical protein